MREIKFRTWDKTREEFLSAGIVSIEIHRGKNPEITMSLDKIMDITKDERFILMQYTGLKDKNNKNEIYESDVAKTPGGSVVEIKWFRGSFGYWYNGNFIAIHQCSVNKEECYLEIIGNKFENSELLEKRI